MAVLQPLIKTVRRDTTRIIGKKSIIAALESRPIKSTEIFPTLGFSRIIFFLFFFQLLLLLFCFVLLWHGTLANNGTLPTRGGNGSTAATKDGGRWMKHKTRPWKRPKDACENSNSLNGAPSVSQSLSLIIYSSMTRNNGCHQLCEYQCRLCFDHLDINDDVVLSLTLTLVQFESWRTWNRAKESCNDAFIIY